MGPTLVVWAALLASVICLETVAVVWPHRSGTHGSFPTMADLLDLVMRRRVGRWIVLGGWLWLGWHLFVRR
jgi:hypothetical protein